MRVTELTKHNTVQNNIMRNAEELQNIMIGISSGKRLAKPSDDPVGAAMVQNFRTSIDHAKSLESNIKADKSWLNSVEGALSQVIESLSYIKGLAVEGSNGSVTEEFRESLSGEIKILTKDLVKLVNTKEGKRHLFSGSKTFTPPLKMQPRLKDAEAMINDTRKQSSEKFIPFERKLPILRLLPGSFTILVDDGEETTPPVELEIEFSVGDSVEDMVRKINEAAIAERNYQESPYFPTGYDALVFCEIGVDDYIYLEPALNHKISFGKEDSSGFLDMMQFRPVGTPPVGPNGEILEPLGPTQLDKELYDAKFNGYSKEHYRVRILREGSYGEAQYIVSDDDGESWSLPQHLQKEIEIFNPEGLASNKVHLRFGVPGFPHFRKGTEFRFDGNEFVEYQGNDQIKEVPIDNGIKVALNITANELFYKDSENPDSINTFEVLNRLIEALEVDDQMAVLKSIRDIEDGVNQVLHKKGQVGSIVRELESSESRLMAHMDHKADELSKVEDMDIAKGALDLNRAETRHKVSLDSGARLIQPTLINFLK